METYLKKIGKQVYKASELMIGDIVGASERREGFKYEEIKLYCVERVETKPNYIKWIGPQCPCVYFRSPTIGFTAKDNNPGRIHIYTPSPGVERYRFKWSEMTLEDALKEGWGEENNFLDIKYECFPLYHITDLNYVKLGSLLPDVDVPSWSVMCQTINGHQPIIDFVENTRDYFKQARVIYDKIKEEERKYS